MIEGPVPTIKKILMRETGWSDAKAEVAAHEIITRLEEINKFRAKAHRRFDGKQ